MDLLQISLNLATLTLLEIVLGIDNLVFVAIVSSRLPPVHQKSARRIGLSLALLGRFALLLAIMWIIKLNTPLFSVYAKSFSGRDIFMILGGLFLLVKATWEIHHELQPKKNYHTKKRKYIGFTSAIIQIIIFDIIFSLDSILTAVGLTKQLWIMMIAITIAVIIMLISSEPLSRFIDRHPAIKILALSFLLLIGTVLVADGFGYSIPKGYIYFSIFFSLFIEFLNEYRHKTR
ncbi:MAG: TerC family protein [Gammaproteobacteria bacterium]|nr:TerC family protein [Gammaproteobacteria bacterium]